MVYVELTIEYRDDKREVLKCGDAPAIEERWVIIYPYDDPTARKYIPTEAVKSIDWHWKCKHNE